MENENGSFYKELQHLEGEIEALLSNNPNGVDKVAFYEALKFILNLKLDVEEVHAKFNELENVFASMAVGDFESKFYLDNRKSVFSYIAAGLNTVIDEQERNLVKKQYCEALLKNISDFALITNKKGVILFSNSTACNLIQRSPENLFRLFVANIFESKTQFGVHNPDLNDIKNVPVQIIPYITKKPLLIYLTIEPVLNNKNELDGYIYIGRNKIK